MFFSKSLDIKIRAFLFVIQIAEVFRLVLAFFIRFVAPFSKKINHRVVFENTKNNKSSKKGAISNNADYAFEISSEGELEQIRYFLIYLLEKKLIVELIYSSISVQKNCEKLKSLYSNLIVYKLNLLHYRPLKKIISAPILILCRYDFYPELLLLSKKKKLILFAASLKNKNLNNRTIYNYFLHNTYNLFDLIITVTKREQEEFCKFYPQKNILSYDFRHIQIISRLEKHNFKFDNLKRSNCKLKFICGSFWFESFFLFESFNLQEFVKKNNILFFIAPHLLNPSNIKKIQKKCDGKIINQLSQFQTTTFTSGIYIISIPGILCELYSYFDLSYVDGGFGRSIHSVLEPFWAENKIIVGPKTHRSSEFDYIIENLPEEIVKIESSRQFYLQLKKYYSNMDKNITDNSKKKRIMLRNDIKNNYSTICKKVV